jgi:ubiquinone/menaquinone biosynthesis C-methylase UbiE
MMNYNQPPVKEIPVNESQSIAAFDLKDLNIDVKTVSSFGQEWTKFDSFSNEEIQRTGDMYFDIIDFTRINENSTVMDVGCGTGRWTKYIAPKVKYVEAVDPSEAIFSAAALLKEQKNVRITQASTDNLPFADNSFDFVFSIGVLHHIPDTRQAMLDCVKKVRPGGLFLVYLYYSLDNRSSLFKLLFWFSNLIRKVVSSMPTRLKKFVCDVLAVLVYMPFVLLARLFNKMGLKKLANRVPLSIYANQTFNIIRNDSLDRFGTPLEQRFSREQIRQMMSSCGLTDIIFSENMPYWHAVGRKA